MRARSAHPGDPRARRARRQRALSFKAAAGRAASAAAGISRACPGRGPAGGPLPLTPQRQMREAVSHRPVSEQQAVARGRQWLPWLGLRRSSNGILQHAIGMAGGAHPCWWSAPLRDHLGHAYAGCRGVQRFPACLHGYLQRQEPDARCRCQQPARRRPPICYCCSLNGYDAGTYDLPGALWNVRAGTGSEKSRGSPAPRRPAAASLSLGIAGAPHSWRLRSLPQGEPSGPGDRDGRAPALPEQRADACPGLPRAPWTGTAPAYRKRAPSVDQRPEVAARRSVQCAPGARGSLKRAWRDEGAGGCRTVG